MDDIQIRTLIIETTRQCQLQCDHCLRGDSDSCVMNKDYIEELLDNVESIDTVTFTGGEPFLNPQCIEDFIHICKRNDIVVGNFFIATNGIIHETRSELAKSGIDAIMGLYQLCDDNEISSIRISNTKWHGDNISDNNLLNIFSFTHYDGADWMPSYIISEGRGAGIHGAIRIETNDIDWEYPTEIDTYLNCNGEVLWNCNLSYETQKYSGVGIAEAKLTLQKIHGAIQEEYA